MKLSSLDAPMQTLRPTGFAGSPHRRGSSRALPLKVGTRGSPLALWQTRHFLSLITKVCPLLREVNAFEEHIIATQGDKILD